MNGFYYRLLEDKSLFKKGKLWKKDIFRANLFAALCSLCLVGCHPRYIKGEILRIEETYNIGFITRNDLLNIAYYIDDEVKYNDEEFEIKEIDNESLNEKIQYSIKVATQKYILKMIAMNQK